ncbi:MAG: LCP family protein [Patescibacteria group bacterium]
MIDFKQKIEEEEKRNRYLEPELGNEIFPANKKRKRLITYIIAVVVIALIFSGRILISSQNGTNWLDNSFLGRLIHLVPGGDKKLQGEENDRINILFLGMGGEGHEGAYLTDTIMLASLQPSTDSAAMVSFPRDLVSPVNGWRKINSINAYAEMAEAGSGAEAARQAMSELLQIPIDYYVRVDFNGFVKIIDEIGGIEIEVENTLNDYSYPIYGQEENPNYYSRFEHLYIEKGRQTMSGSLALKYTRSRHAGGIEGSDYARARRQQLVLEAVKEKLLSKQTLLNPVTIGKLINEFDRNVSTNLNVWEMVRLWDLVKDINRDQVINKVLSDAPDNFLTAGTGEDGAFILMPRSGNYAEIRNMVQNIFNNGEAAKAAPQKIETIKDGATVIILNGTWISGLAGKTAVMLEQAKFEINKIGNAPTRDYSKTMVYDLTYGRKKDSLEILKKSVGATSAFDAPDWLNAYRPASSTEETGLDRNDSADSNDANGTASTQTETTADFILILGTDANKAE